jgi:hypothetical protein
MLKRRGSFHPLSFSSQQCGNTSELANVMINLDALDEIVCVHFKRPGKERTHLNDGSYARVYLYHCNRRTVVARVILAARKSTKTEA